MPCTIMAMFGKGHMHLSAQQYKYHSQGFLIWFFFPLSLLCPRARCLLSWSVIPGTKIMRLLHTAKPRRGDGIEIQHYELTCP